ncbi:MAG TPA: VOC family protein [Gaiellaceae bacterium]|nr:VOC family protein [Gaiellaceae bacterium]
MTQVAPETIRLAPGTRMGPVELTVTDLDRSVPFYEEAIGLRLRRREGGTAALGAGGEDLLVLVEEPEARPAGRHAGLYHFAILHPSRLELARAAARLAAARTPIDGASDHGISEAIYLPDPDGNGIELASDRPQEAWPDLSSMSGGPDPLDLRALLELAAGEEPRPSVDPETAIGHVHLHVGDLEAALRFYHDVVGFDVMTTLPSAVFVAAGGYHHHVGFNTWRGAGVPPAPEDAVGLRHFTVLLTGQAELDAVRARAAQAGVAVAEAGGGLLLRDPSGNALLFRAG